MVLVSEIDDIYRWAIDASQNGAHDNELKRLRFRRMVQLALESPLGGDMAQVGVWHGHSLLMIAESCLREGREGKLVGIDSFQGFSPLSKEPGHQNAAHFVSNVKSVRQLFGPYENVRVHQGWIPRAFDALDSKAKYSFVAIDVDLGKPTLDSLRYFWPRMIAGGIVYVDDYGYADYPLCKKAVDLFCSANDIATSRFEADSGIWWCSR